MKSVLIEKAIHLHNRRYPCKLYIILNMLESTLCDRPYITEKSLIIAIVLGADQSHSSKCVRTGVCSGVGMGA